MDHVVAMAVLDRLQQLVDEAADLVKLDAVGVLLEDLEQVLVEVLKDQVQTVAPNRRKQEKNRLFDLIDTSAVGRPPSFAESIEVDILTF